MKRPSRAWWRTLALFTGASTTIFLVLWGAGWEHADMAALGMGAGNVLGAAGSLWIEGWRPW